MTEEMKEQVELDGEVLDSEEVKSKKSSLKRFIFAGWKKRFKRLHTLLCICFYLGLTILVASIFLYNVFGWRIDVFAKRVALKKYVHNNPDFNFQHSDYFRIDTDENKKYGESYLIGLKLNTDPKIGCDVRLNSVGINFEKSDAEIIAVVSKEMSQGVKDFNLISAERIKLYSGENAFFLDYSLTDSANSKSRINQAMTSKDGKHYILICGGNDYYHKYFKKDFELFFETFSWK